MRCDVMRQVSILGWTLQTRPLNESNTTQSKYIGGLRHYITLEFHVYALRASCYTSRVYENVNTVTIKYSKHCCRRAAVQHETCQCQNQTHLAADTDTDVDDAAAATIRVVS